MAAIRYKYAHDIWASKDLEGGSSAIITHIPTSEQAKTAEKLNGHCLLSQ